LIFAGDSYFFVGSADGEEIAPPAGALFGRRRQKALFDGVIDDL
jgi:hypothetical protein